MLCLCSDVMFTLNYVAALMNDIFPSFALKTPLCCPLTLLSSALGQSWILCWPCADGGVETFYAHTLALQYRLFTRRILVARPARVWLRWCKYSSDKHLDTFREHFGFKVCQKLIYPPKPVNAAGGGEGGDYLEMLKIASKRWLKASWMLL